MARLDTRFVASSRTTPAIRDFIPTSNSDTMQAIDQLPPAPEGWLEDALTKLHRVTRELGSYEDPDDVMRYAIRAGVEVFGFFRIGAWFFEGADRRSLIGTFGVGKEGEFTDERHLRIFDRTGSIPLMVEAWDRSPYVFWRTDHVLRSGAAQIVGRGIQIASPLSNYGEYRGMLSVDDLLGNGSVNDKTGFFLNQFATVISGLYFERKKNKAYLRMEEVARQAEQVKVDFLGMMSHEIRTPLNAIMGYSQLLCAESSSDSTRSLARTIEESGDHLVGLINGMLDYAQLSGTDINDWASPCDPVSITGSTVASFEKSAQEAGIALTYSHTGDFEGYVMAEPVGYRQVLTNLVQNALKFTPRKGSVHVSLQTRRKTENAIEFYVTVEDSGIGMSEEDLLEIFKPFKQLDSSRTRKAGGVGMGLAIVDRLVRTMGGAMECESEEGKGTIFRLDFVFKLADTSQLAQESGIVDRVGESKRQKEDLRLLVAEDNEENLKVLVSMLEHLGYPGPTLARDGNEARDSLLAAPYDLVFLDIQMPEIDGLTIVHDLRAGSYGPINQEIPVLGISANSLKYDREQCLIMGMSDCVTKPLKLETLREAVGRMLA